MLSQKTVERPLGVYLASFYFVVSGFMEAIQKYREWGAPLIWNPLSEHSIWHLATHAAIYLAVAYLIWQLTWLGRLWGLVYGYLTLATYAGAFLLYLKGTPGMSSTPLFMVLGIYHVAALIPVVAYLQPKRRKKLFQVSLLEILLPPQ
ncbi:MAG TPA: hypothetical protein VJB88_09460 [Vicinamibacteria bacterium]|nr:hypothetical protein [Vicinamibacteria bacterium]